MVHGITYDINRTLELLPSAISKSLENSAPAGSRQIDMTTEIKYCMRCLTELNADTRRECFKCKRVTCSERSCGIWAVINRFWTCQICVNEEIEAMIDVQEKTLD